jgi:hypothetical protein
MYQGVTVHYSMASVLLLRVKLTTQVHEHVIQYVQLFYWR